MDISDLRNDWNNTDDSAQGHPVVLRLVPAPASTPDSDQREHAGPVIAEHDREPDIGVAELAAYEERLRMALMARYGPQMVEELTAECMAWAWEHQSRLATMKSPVGYLLRVGQSRARRLLRWRREQVRFPARHSASGAPWFEPGLPAALQNLDPDTRTAVVLVHCFQWSYLEVSDLLDLPLHTVRNRIHRGLNKLRTDLGAHDV